MNALIVGATKNLTMDSLEISKLTGKRHDHILRDIDNILNTLNLSHPKYEEAIQSKTGTIRKFNLPKDLVLTLISGYNIKLRKSIIDRWLELEKPKTGMELVLDSIKFLEEKVLEEKEKNLLLENKIEENKPKVEFANTVADSSDVILVREYAKILYDKEGIEIGQNKLFKWFRENGYLNSRNEPYQNYMQYFKIVETTNTSIWGTKINKTTKITGRGQLYFLSKLREWSKKTQLN